MMNALRRVSHDPWLIGVLAIGLVVRAVLIPITHGQDFVVWDLASRATLHGVNIYANHPAYPGGPYAYFPLMLDVEAPFQWFAQHTPFSFLILGKLPILAGDVACALLIARELQDGNRSGRAVALWTAAFFLNPLVLYNSAYYGRFDTIGCALLLAALRMLRRTPQRARGAVSYALAIAAKSFPAFLLPGVLKWSGTKRRRNLAVVVGVLAYLSLPYLNTPKPFMRDVVLYDAVKESQGLSWQPALVDLTSAGTAKLLGYVLLVVFACATVWFVKLNDIRVYVAATLVAFILCSKVVLEQYLIWPMAWLLLIAATGNAWLGRASMALAGVFTVAGLLECESYHPFGRPSDYLNVTLAACCLAYLAFAVQPRLFVPKVSHALGSPV